MSRTSRITEGLTELVEAGIIQSFTHMPGISKSHWLVLARDQLYLTSSEVEAFLAGAATARPFALNRK